MCQDPGVECDGSHSLEIDICDEIHLAAILESRCNGEHLSDICDNSPLVCAKSLYVPLFEAFAQYFWPKYTEKELWVGGWACKRESEEARTYLFLSTLGLTRLTEGFVAVALYLPTAVITMRL